jgi:hypothetical protein
MFAEDWDFFIKLAVRYNIFTIDKTTSYLIDHGDRNMRNFDETKWVVKRDALLKSLESDEVVREGFKNRIKSVSAHMNSLISVNLAARKFKLKSLRYLMTASYRIRWNCLRGAMQPF